MTTARGRRSRRRAVRRDRDDSLRRQQPALQPRSGQRALHCAARPPPARPTSTILRRNVEGGGRQDDLRHTSYRGVVGVKGDVSTSNWNYDVSATYSTVIFSETYHNDFSITRSQRALDVVATRDGSPVCRSVVDGTDPNCVPYNIWTLGGVTPEALGYLQIPLFSSGNTELQHGLRRRCLRTSATTASSSRRQRTASALRSVRSTAGAVADFETDSNFATGDGAGQGGPTIGTGWRLQRHGPLRRSRVCRCCRTCSWRTDLTVERQLPLFGLQQPDRRIDQHLRCRPRVGADRFD